MAGSINRVVIVGNLTHDPELRALPSGTSVCQLRVAVNDRVKNQSTGEWGDRANYFDVNVFGTFRVTKEVIRHFKEQGGGGRIVNIASGAGLAGNPYMAPYSASKHAVVGFTRSIAGEVAKDGISVNAVCPGCVESPMINRITDNLSVCTGLPVSFVEDIPLGRYARPDEIGNVVAYLVVDAPLYLTGTTIVIDGGLRS